MNTKDTTEVAGEFTVQVSRLGTAFYFPQAVVTL